MLVSQTDASWVEFLLGPLGLTAGLILAVWAFSTRRIITRGTYEEMRADRNQWRQIALEGVQLGRHASSTALQAVELAKGNG